MSGPATAAFSFAPFQALRLALVVAREAQLMRREYQEVFEELQHRAKELQSVQHSAAVSRQEHLKATRVQAERLLAQCQRLRKLARDSGLGDRELDMSSSDSGVLVLPTTGSVAAWEASVLALQQEADSLSHLMDNHIAAAYVQALSKDTGTPTQSLDDVLQVYVAQRSLRQELQPAEADACRDLAKRILSRLDLEVGEAIPRELEEMGLALALAPSMAQAELMAVDLRMKVQQQRDRRHKGRADARQAQELLEAMGDDAPAAVRELLEHVICLGEPMHPDTLTMAQEAQSLIDKAHRQAQDALAAEVLEQSLRDLGYEVQGVEHTLFVDGGIAHFQRQGWEDYFVRMRVSAREKSMNFNVVRRRGANESAERRRLDVLAEDRWCAEFPRLQETLAARGIRLNVQRLLGAGEVPVQIVEPDSVQPLRSAEPSIRAMSAAEEMRSK
jgi:hypothetical protein